MNNALTMSRQMFTQPFRGIDARMRGIVGFITGLLLAISACGMLAAHAQRFAGKRDEAVVIGTALPKLKANVSLLRASVSAEKLFAEEGLASREEQAEVYLLPDKSPAPRIAKIAGDIGSTIGTGFNVERVEFAAAQDSSRERNTEKTLPVSMRLRGNFQQVSRFLGILGMSGNMMVKDILSEETQESFLQKIENIAPLSIERATKFLYLDLLSYAANADEEEARILEDLPEEAAGSIRALLLSGGLGSVRAALAEGAAELRAKSVWPLPLLRADSLVRKGDVWEVGMTGFFR